MQPSLTQIGAVSSSDSDLETTSPRLHLAPLPTLPSCEPSNYTTEIWQSLRTYLKFCGYRLVTQRDMAFEMAEATGNPIPDHWNGPPSIDDELYSASSTGAIFDGYRLSDSLRVTFKILNISDSYELDVLSYLRLSDSSVKGDPRNKAIPVLEILKLTEEREIAVIETWSPYWSSPPVTTWAEFADFMHQVLEGLAYFHEHRIAHLDISDGNILSGPLSAFDSTSDPKPPRSFAFIDFELSIIYPPSHPGPFEVIGDVATHVAPEMSAEIGYDPFKADVWQMGTLLKRAAKEREFEMTPLQELLQAMTREVPEDRPTAGQALDAFAAIEQDCRD